MKLARYWRWALGAVVAYALVGFLILPWIVKPVAVSQLKKHLGRDATIQKLRLNPFALSVTIDSLQINERDAPDRFVAWDRLHVNVQLSSLFHRALVLREVSLSNAFAHVAIQPDRTLNFSDLIPPPSTNAPAPPPTIRIGKLNITGAQLVADDHSRREPFTTTIGPVNAALQNFSTRPDNKNPYSFTATTESGEHFAWRGAFHLQPIRSNGDFVIGRIALPKYAPYLDQFPNLHVRDGRLSVRGAYAVNLDTNAPVATLTNTTIVLESLRLADRAATNDAIAIANLTVTDLVADALAGTLAIGEVALRGERIAVVMSPGQPPNVLTIFATPPSPTPASNVPPRNFIVHVHRVTSTDGAASLTGILGSQAVQWTAALITNIHIQTHPLQASVAAITVTNGAFTHTDDAVQPPARLHVQQIHQTITGFALDPESTARVHLTAKVNNVAPIEITGSLTPATLNRADVKILFRDVSLLPLDPYVGKYLGYRLDSGSVSLDLRYDVNQRQLAAANLITVDQMNLGAATDSADAIKLPVKLGLAILKDRHGVITLDVPITGSLDDPQFKLRKVILTTFKNLFLKILTSPFAALGAMFGGGGDDLGYQEFLPGRAELQPSETKKLDLLLRALTERPGLILAIQGGYDPIADDAGLRRVKLDEQLATTPLRDLYLANLDQLRATIVITNEPTAAETTGFSNIRGLQPRTAPKPTVTAIPTARAEAAKTLPEEMERQLLEIIPITETDLAGLAAARATAVRDYLLQPTTLDPARLTVVPDPKPAASRVHLTLQ